MAIKPRGRSKFWLFSKDPNQATFLPSKVQIASMALEEMSFESVNGRTTGQMFQQFGVKGYVPL